MSHNLENISYLWVHFIRNISPPFLCEWIHVRIIVPPNLLLLRCLSGEIGVGEMENMNDVEWCTQVSGEITEGEVEEMESRTQEEAYAIDTWLLENR